MTLTSIIIFLLIIAILYLFYIVFNLKKEIKELKEEIKKYLSDLKLEETLTNLTQNSNSIHELANNLFANVKLTFGLKSKTYSLAIKEIQEKPLDPKIKELLLDFFNDMILISYKDENISEQEKEDLKQKIKVIMNLLEKYKNKK